VIASLMERHATLGEKIDIAGASLRRIEQQLEALDVVRGLFGDEELLVHAPPPMRPAPIPAMTATPAAPAPHVRLVEEPSVQGPERFRLGAYLRCLSEGHDMMVSRSMSGHVTCRKCRVRRRF
jgi:hypothetical protein